MWVVDTCVLIDVLEDDPDFGAASARLLDERASEKLAICPIVYAELAPAFEGSNELQQEYLRGVGVDFRRPWSWQDTRQAHAAWNRYAKQRRQRLAPKRPLADILIGAFAAGCGGLITRNRADFAGVFPDLLIIEP